MRPCPICGDPGPWSHGGQRAAHIRSHHEASCPECGQTVNVVGLESHRRILHGVDGDAPAQVSGDVAARAEAPPSTSDDAGPRTSDEAPKPEQRAPAENMPADIPAAPTPTGLLPAPADMCCPACGKGPFDTLKGYRAHERSHVEVECGDCGKRIKANAVGPHRRGCPGPGGKKPAAAAKRARPHQVTSGRPAPIPAPATAGGPTSGNYVRCIDCGQSVHRDNLDAHRRRFHKTGRPKPTPVAAATTPPERARGAPRRPIEAALRELVGPRAAGELLERLAAFAAKHELDEGADRMLVATDTAGPWVVRTTAVGLVIAREHAAAIVVAVDDLVAHVRRQTTKATA